MNYNSNFRYDLKVGQVTEQLLGSILENQTIEVKDDSAKSAKTGNVFIEFKSRGKRSGIAKSHADWWAIRTSEDTFVIVSAKKLRELAKKYYKLKRIVKGGDNNTSWGILIPREELL
jgi:hypothetical protein